MSEAIVIDATPDAQVADRMRAYVELTKPRIAGMVLIAAMVGFFVAGSLTFQVAGMAKLLVTLAGIGLVAAGANALNQYLEADFDAQMDRTRRRPIPSGRLTRFEVLTFGVLTSVTGIAALLLWATPLSALLTATTLVSYVLVYTPLKRVTSLCVYVGAIPGALPPVIGWAAASGAVAFEAWLLFAILYFWQLPHFAAIAWQYRHDYAGAGYRMISVDDAQGMRTCRHLVTHTVALLSASLLPALTTMTGSVYPVAAMILGTMFLLVAARFVLQRTATAARAVVLASVIYLPILFVTMMLDKAA